jgi:hypothetical protein
MRALIHSCLRAGAAALLLALPVSPAIGDEVDDSIDAPVLPQLKVLGEGGFVYQGESDIDDGGNVQVFRYDLGVAGRTNLTDHLRWTNTFFFGVSDYDFDGGGFSSPDPWDTILTTRLGTKLTYALTPQWGISAGGVFSFSPETGANWGDSFTGGGLVGVEYRHSDTFSASLGLAVISQIEDDVTVAPSVGVVWLPAEHWTVRVGAVPASGGSSAAAEVSYRFADPVEVALGVLYHQRRFRLDDSGVAPDGVGEDNNLPVRVRVGWNFTPQLALNFLAGAVFGGEVRLEDEDGNRIAKSDYDPAAYLGLRLVGRF